MLSVVSAAGALHRFPVGPIGQHPPPGGITQTPRVASRARLTAAALVTTSVVTRSARHNRSGTVRCILDHTTMSATSASFACRATVATVKPTTSGLT
jgi:hypothetical protein